jgi:hypothetical protein
MTSKLEHWIVRQIYYRHINILGWPTRRQRAVWWLYEWKYLEKWRDVAIAIDRLVVAQEKWLGALEKKP